MAYKSDMYGENADDLWMTPDMEEDFQKRKLNNSMSLEDIAKQSSDLVDETENTVQPVLWPGQKMEDSAFKTNYYAPEGKPLYEKKTPEYIFRGYGPLSDNVVDGKRFTTKNLLEANNPLEITGDHIKPVVAQEKPVGTPIEQPAIAQEKIIAPKATNTDPADKSSFEWGPVIGRLAAGFTPMALEALFGGNKKYYGAAAKGGLGGLKMYDTLDNTRWNREMQLEKLNRLPSSGKNFKLESVTKPNGEAQLVNYNQSTGQYTPTEFSPYNKPSQIANRPYTTTVRGLIDDSQTEVPITVISSPDGKIRHMYGNEDVTGRVSFKTPPSLLTTSMRKDQFEQKQIENKSKRIQKESDLLIPLSEYATKYRDLRSLQGDNAKIPDSELPADLQMERSAVRTVINAKLHDFAGSAQTDQEFQRFMAQYGLSCVMVTKSEYLLSPSKAIDKIFAQVNANVIRAALDRDVDSLNLTLKNIEGGYSPEVNKTFNQKVPLPSLNKKQISPQPVITPKPVKTPTFQGSSILEDIKKKRGLQ